MVSVDKSIKAAGREGHGVMGRRKQSCPMFSIDYKLLVCGISVSFMPVRPLRKAREQIQQVDGLGSIEWDHVEKRGLISMPHRQEFKR